MYDNTEPVVNAPRAKFHLGFTVIFTLIVVLANLLALRAAWQDKSWGALYIAVIDGPILNGVLVLAGCVVTALLRRRCSKRSMWRHLAIACGVPIGAIVIDAWLIFSMDLGGC